MLCPNTAIQAQWMAQWQAAFCPGGGTATASRELPTPLTVLTYQALCTLGSAAERRRRATAAPRWPRTAAGRPREGLDGTGLALLHPERA